MFKVRQILESTGMREIKAGRRAARTLPYIIVSVIYWASTANFSTSRSEPLDKAACIELAAEKEKYIKSGIEQTFKKGAEWAKANLSEASLQQVKEYLTVEEKLLFRCPNLKGKARAALPKATAKIVAKSTPTTAKKTLTITIPLPVRPSRSENAVP